MLKKIFFLLFLALFASLYLQGQTPMAPDSLTNTPVSVDADTLVSPVAPASLALPGEAKENRDALRSDSIVADYEQKLERLHRKYLHFTYNRADTLSNPYYFYLFTRPTYYNAPIEAMMKLPKADYGTSADNGLLSSQQEITPNTLLDQIYNTLGNVYAKAPYYVRQEEDWAKSGIRSDVNKEVKPEVKLTDKINETTPDIVDDYQADDWSIVVHKPNFWTFKANVGLQLMQYFVSDNWYKGGESHYSWLATSILEANYNNKQKLTFDNKLEMRLGFQSTKEDKKHKFRSNTDQIRLTNKLGLKAANHWYYTLMLQSWTQFYPGYKQNDEKVYSDFMSPFESILTLGMDYKLELKKFNMSATISPFAGNFKYVDRKNLAPSFGIHEGDHAKFDFGSNVTIRYNWNIAKNISLAGRLFYFTDYETTRVEWENTFNLTINRFLSTKIYLFPRFDDGVTRKEGDSYFQFQESLSLGFNFDF